MTAPKSPKIIFAVLAAVFVLSVGATVFLIVNERRVLHPSETARLAGELSVLTEETVVVLPQMPPPSVPLMPSISEEIEAEETEMKETPAELEIRPEFLALREAFNNDDIVGHLWIEGTAIDYIVVQGADNEFYLYHDIHKNPSTAGWIFLDYYVDLAQENHNTVIYGHNMRAGIMFHDIRFFADYDFFRRHSIINFNTLYEDAQWEVFAFYTAHISFPYTHINYGSTTQWEFMLDNFTNTSIHNTDIVLTADDRILTLSTCVGGAYRDYRFVLQARLIRHL